MARLTAVPGDVARRAEHPPGDDETAESAAGGGAEAVQECRKRGPSAELVSLRQEEELRQGKHRWRQASITYIKNAQDLNDPVGPEAGLVSANLAV